MKTSEMMDKSYIVKEQDYLKKELEEFTKRPVTVEHRVNCTYKLPCGWCEKRDCVCTYI